SPSRRETLGVNPRSLLRSPSARCALSSRRETLGVNPRSLLRSPSARCAPSSRRETLGVNPRSLLRSPSARCAPCLHRQAKRRRSCPLGRVSSSPAPLDQFHACIDNLARGLGPSRAARGLLHAGDQIAIAVERGDLL